MAPTNLQVPPAPSDFASALCLFIEPAPYIARLDEEIHRQWPGNVSSWYIAASVSQRWQDTTGTCASRILPHRRHGALSVLWQEMQQRHPRVVFVAGWSHPIVIIAIVMARIIGAKVVAFSDTWISDSSGLRDMVKRSVLRLIHRFAPGGRQQACYLRNLGVPDAHIFPANMTVDTAAMRAYLNTEGPAQRNAIRDALGLGVEDPLFLFVGRLEPEKGADLLLEAFTALSRGRQAQLVIVGDGSMRPMVEQAVAQDNRIVYRGRLEGEELWAQFAAADAFVAPSRAEAWGLVVNEALTAGLAIILSDRFGCIDDLVRSDESGLIIPGEDCDSLSRAMLRLVDDPALLARLRANAPSKIDGWTSQAWAKNIITVWQDVLRVDR